MAKRKASSPPAEQPAAPGIAASNRLADLAGRVRDAEAERASSSLAAAERTLEAGRLLLEAKEACRHGEWLPFLDLAGIAERQAQRLMLLVRGGLKADTVSELGMRAALDLAAARQRLPEAGEVLALSLGKGLLDGRVDSNEPEIFELNVRTSGETADDDAAAGALAAVAFVWQAAEPSGHFHVVAWRNAAGDASGELVALARPISGERVDAVFAAVDAMLGRQAVTIERLSDAAIDSARQLQLEAVAEQVQL